MALFYRDFTYLGFWVLQRRPILGGVSHTKEKKKTIMKKTAIILPAAMLALTSLVGCSTKEMGGVVSTDGSTSMERVICTLGEAFLEANPRMSFTYNPTGSGSGIQAVREGRCDIGLSSRALKPEEVAQGLTGTVLSYDGIAIIVNPKNPVSDLDVDTVAKLYKGEIANWKEIGGEDLPVVLIGREAGSGTRSGFEEATGTSKKCKYRQELTSTGNVITAVAQNPGAVGYASLASIEDSVKVLKIGGVTPTEESVKSGQYAVQRPFVMVTKTGVPLSAAAQTFVDFARSADGAKLIVKAGSVPAN